MRVQGPVGDQVGPGQRPHIHTISAQVGVVAVVQGGQGSRQARLLAHNQALRERQSDLPDLLYLMVQGPEKPMHGIMEHAWGWCK